MAPMPCSNCAATIPDRYRLCGACGTPRDGLEASADVRRFATVVNSDLKGSTALGERLDPESLREVLTLYFDAMRAVFESHGGTIEKIIGDAIVAVFGLPVRHDDDALRAVEAAAESQLVLASLNDRLDVAWGVRLVVRTGVATGDVIFGEARIGQHVLTGATMSISSAMEQHAPPFEVLLAASTYDLVADMVDVETVETILPKGATEPVGAYRLLAVHERVDMGVAEAVDLLPDLRLCPACGEENPESFRLCGMCGTVLTSFKPVRDTRKTVTLVFADPRPATLDGSSPTAEALRDVMTRYFEAMRLALEHHGGTVEKFIGDAVMAVFGLPVRHEDDALRAVRAAVAMQSAIPGLNEAFRATWGIELGSHIGVNTGEVIAGDASLGQRLVTGDAVNTAARLEQAAGPRETIIGALTYRLARDQIEVEPIAPLSLKGKAEPVAAFRLVGIARLQPDTAAQATPFVGRAEELDRLEMTLLQVEARRSCELVTVIGEAGVGKSRLVREFASRASSGDRAQVLRGRCLPYGDGVTFWPIAEIVRRAAEISDDDPPELALAKIAEIARGAARRTDDPAGIADRVGAAIGLSATPFPGPELFWGIRKLFEAMASRRPLVAIIDDIHAAAPTFLELLDHLIDAIHGTPVLLLTTARHELAETRSEWAEGHAEEQIVLDALSTDDADAIVDGLLAGLDPRVRSRIVTAAEGNPLYVEQISSMLVETGALQRVGDDWVATVASGELPIPPTIEALVAARLDALRFEERQLIDPASVIGLGFPVDAVVHLVPEEAAASVPAWLAALTAKQFIRPSADDEIYRFGHSVIKDTAYGSLLKRTRAGLHERFVDWVEPINRERGRELEFEEILGYHLEQAYRYRRELGSVDQDVTAIGRRAAQKLSSAGRRAFGRGDAPAAANLLGRSAAVLPTLDPGRIELLTEQAEAEIEQGEFKPAASVLDEAKVRADSLGDPRLMAREALVRYQLSFTTTGSVGNVKTVIADVQAMKPLFEAAGDLSGLARAMRVLWVIHGTSGALESAADAASEVAEIASRIGDTRLAARAAIAYSQAALESSMPVQEALERCEALLDAVSEDRIAEARFLPILGVFHAMQGDFEEARRLYRRSHELVAELGRNMTVAASSQESSRIELLAGDPAAAESELRRDYATLEAVGERYIRSTIAGLLGHVLIELGRDDEANAFVVLAVDLAGADDVFSQVVSRTARARLLARAGQFDEALATGREAVAMASEGAYIEQEADARLHLAEILALAGRPEDAHHVLTEAAALYQRKGDVTMAGVANGRMDPLLSRP